MLYIVALTYNQRALKEVSKCIERPPQWSPHALVGHITLLIVEPLKELSAAYKASGSDDGHCLTIFIARVGSSVFFGMS